MKTVETMANHLHKVTYKEQLIICHVIRERTDKLKYAHLTPALLPFVPMTDVHLSLASKKASRPIAVILAKVGTEFQYKDRVWLLDRKVMKVFGPNPQLGTALQLAAVKEYQRKAHRTSWWLSTSLLTNTKEAPQSTTWWCTNPTNSRLWRGW